MSLRDEEFDAWYSTLKKEPFPYEVWNKAWSTVEHLDKTMIMRSATCACYRDDDGLHPCEDLHAVFREQGTYLRHIIDAFGLHVAPEKPMQEHQIAGPVTTPEDIVWGQIEAIRRHQKNKWGLEHDLQHDSWEWLGLIAQYAAAGKYTDAAALCFSAALAERARAGKSPTSMAMGGDPQDGRPLGWIPESEISPEKPKRAVKLENGWWRAPCGCEVHTETHGLGTTCADYYGPNHLIKAVAAVMREQVPPMPTDDEIEAAYEAFESGRLVNWSEHKWTWRAGVKWALERKP